MRKFSRSIALLLCIVMVLGMLPATIFAAGGNNTPAFTLTTEDDIDFTNPDDASKFTILNKNSSAIQEGVGLKMITTTDAFEDCNGQVTPGEPADAVKVPVDGDWTATLKFDFSRGFAANGYYQFFGFYAAQGDDFQNLAGIRGGDGAMQNFLRVDGTITADSPDLNSTPGLVSVGTYWYRIVKAGTTYTCYRSADGEKFTEMFSYTDTGIEADSIIIDAYTGMTAGFTFTLKSLFFGETDPEGSEPPVDGSPLAGLEIPDADEIRGNITLVDEFNGETVTWTSSNPAVITDEAANGKAAGVVTRGKTDQEVTLTASAGGETKEIKVTVKAAPKEITEDNYAGYLFAHFIGERTADQEQIYFAVSEDGRHFTDMNDGEPVIRSTVGEMGLRDPYMYRSPEGDRFFIVATDLSIYHRGGWKINAQGYYDPSTTGSHYLVVYESTDLVDWGEPKWIKVAPENAGMAWAPEMIYHEESGQYIIFFASSIMDPETKYKAKPNAIYYVTTRDFVNFSETKLLIDNQTDGVEEGGKPREIIDATIIKIGDWYYCAAKDGDNAEANGGIRVMKTQDLLDYTSWEKVYDLDELNLDLTGLTGLKNGKIDNSTLEGPELFRFNKKDWANPNVPEYGLFADQYATGSGYLPIITTDLEDVDNSKNSWKILRPGEYSFDMLKKRHGTIVNLTQEELARVKEAYANSEQYLADKEAKKIANTLTIANSWNITEDIDLVTEKDGATITWTSSNPDVITINGSKAEVTRGASDQWVNLTATVKLGEGTATKSIRVRVLKADTGVHTITLDPNGGSVSETAIEVEHGKTASLPTPYRAGRYRFLGWFDKDGKQYTASTPITEDVTLTARWKYTGGGSHVDPVEPSKPVEPAEPAKPDTDFVDVKAGDWYEEAVSYVAENGLMTGVGNGKFNPDGAVTRAMVWTVLARMAGENTEGGSTWYAKAQAWAMETGVSDGTNPMGSITREQLATMLYRYEGSPAVSGSLNAYPDANQVSDWAVDAMIWATEEGIINGINGYLKPQDGATRAQLATMLMRWREQA